MSKNGYESLENGFLENGYESLEDENEFLWNGNSSSLILPQDVVAICN